MDIIFCVNPNDPPTTVELLTIQQHFGQPHDLSNRRIMLYGVSGSGKTYQADRWHAHHKDHPLRYQEVYNNTISPIDNPKKRHTAKTKANDQSSRRHLITTCLRCDLHCVDTAGLEQGELGSTQINLDLSAVQTWMKKISHRESEQAVRSFSRTRKITQILNMLQIRTLVLCFRSTGVSLTCTFGSLGRQVHFRPPIKSKTEISNILQRLDRIESELSHSAGRQPPRLTRQSEDDRQR